MRASIPLANNKVCGRFEEIEKMVLHVDEFPTGDDAAEMLRKAAEAIDAGSIKYALQLITLAQTQLERRKNEAEHGHSVKVWPKQKVTQA